MKILFENWRNFRNEALNEANPAAQEMRDRIAAHQGVESSPARSGSEIATALGYDDPDSDTDDGAELLNMAPEINRAFIEKVIGDFSFNSGQSSQHRWSPRQPIIDYYFDERIGNWKFQAAIPDGTGDADNWPTLNSDPKESIAKFLIRVKENPHQLNLPLKSN
tara:strand:+ start:12 stop:503 length:492 start_codon:yes stop_codon:yes gene_type:complete